MASIVPEGIPDFLDSLFRTDSGASSPPSSACLATSTWPRRLHDAFAAAVEGWPVDGVPANPRAWLVSTGRFKAIDASVGGPASTPPRTLWRELRDGVRPTPGRRGLEDDQLRLIFTCCHPALPPEARRADPARSLRAHHREIARAFLRPRPPGTADRPGQGEDPRRAHSLRVPGRAELPDAWTRCCRSSTWCSTKATPRPRATADPAGPSAEAIRLGRLLLELLPEPEAIGLLALMLLQESRRGRPGLGGRRLVLLDDQDRSRWDRALIAEGRALVEQALASRRLGPTRSRPPLPPSTPRRPRPRPPTGRRSWGCTTLLARVAPSPVVDSTGPRQWPCGTAPRPGWS